MKYFNRIDTLEGLKAEYRRFAKENHPDHGGDTEAMKEINAEFDLAFRIIEKRAKVKTEETAGDFRRTFYTQNGWAGSRYNPNLRLRDIAPIVRGYVKDVYPTWRFSVVQEHYTGGCSLYVSVTETPDKIFTDEGIRKWAEVDVWKKHHAGTMEQSLARCQELVRRGYIQNWEWYYDYMTERAKEVLTDIQVLVNSYRFDDSDGMYDYFNTNFYPHFYIGKYQKPLRIVPRRERIQTNKSVENAARITA